jgi:hypothetical protein
MTAITEAINILEIQFKPLAEKRKQIAITYRTQLAEVNEQLKPINRALKALKPKSREDT